MAMGTWREDSRVCTSAHPSLLALAARPLESGGAGGDTRTCASRATHPLRSKRSTRRCDGMTGRAAAISATAPTVTPLQSTSGAVVHSDADPLAHLIYHTRFQRLGEAGRII